MQTNNRGLVIALMALVLLVVLVPALGGGMMGWGSFGPGMMGGYGAQSGGMGGWQWGLLMGLGGLAMLAFWAAVVVGIVLLVRSVGGWGPTAAPRGETAQDVLKRRLAAGEITLEEYERMWQVLNRP